MTEHIIFKNMGEKEASKEAVNREEYLNTLQGIVEGNKNNVFTHARFLRIWENALEKANSDEGQSKVPIAEETTPISYGEGKEVLLYHDLKEILNIMNLHPNNTNECQKDFEKFLKGLPRFKLCKAPDKYTWYNSTKKGINLRPGKSKASGKLPPAIRMSGQLSHAIVGGRTGSGKSVFLNNILVNLLIEYAPWELELYLADFKKVELSRYMNKYPTPHVRACAATSEVDYVLSLIKYIKERKDDREILFSRLEVLDIEEFRDRYPTVIMPRILFLVDEFQQLFIDATTKQIDIVNDLITDITRKGRAAGVHLLFASQDMSGALTEKQMTNFKIRFALGCDASISTQILGNTGATSLRLGEVICNTASKNSEDNITYIVPLVDDKESSGKTENKNSAIHSVDDITIDESQDSYFYEILKRQEKYAVALEYDYRGAQRFYNEVQQWDIKELETILKKNRIIKARNSIGSNNFISLILGKKVIHTDEVYNIYNYYIERGRNRNILCTSGNNTDLAYMMKLLADNFGTVGKNFAHRVMDLNPVITSLYPHEKFKEDVEILEQEDDEIFRYKAEDLDSFVYSVYKDRKELIGLLQNTEEGNDVLSFCKNLIEKALEGQSDLDKKATINYIMNNELKFLNADGSNIEQFIEKHQNSMLIDHIKLYYKYKIKKVPIDQLHNPLIVWFSGIDNIEKFPRWFEEVASNCLSVNMYFIFLSTTVVDIDVSNSCNYMLISGEDSKLYDKYYGQDVIISTDNVKIYSFIKNRNEHAAFKKYKYTFNTVQRNSLDLDKILL